MYIDFIAPKPLWNQQLRDVKEEDNLSWSIKELAKSVLHILSRIAGVDNDILVFGKYLKAK